MILVADLGVEPSSPAYGAGVLPFDLSAIFSAKEWIRTTSFQALDLLRLPISPPSHVSLWYGRKDLNPQ